MTNGLSAETSEILTLTVTDLARGGSGVARDATGRVVFIPFTAPGDRVRAQVERKEKKYAHARLLEILEPSSQRVTPRCPVFGRCGGCSWQHLPYETQWTVKVRGVKQALSRAGVDLRSAGPLEWADFPADSAWNYRNRVQLRGNASFIGFLGARSHELVPIRRCDIAREEINGSLDQIASEGSALGRDYKVELEVRGDSSIEAHWDSPHAARGFCQVNDRQNENLRSWVRDAIGPGRRVIDLYGGAGNLSLPLAPVSTQVDCVDVEVGGGPVPPNFRFHRSNALPWLRAQTRPDGTPVAAIIDPPRGGVGPAIGEMDEALRSLGANILVAVGCDPDRWAADLRGWIARAWKIRRIAVLDFFPQTPHVETAAQLEIPESGSL